MKSLVMGAGLVGCTLAIALKKRGHEVELFEKRSDMRLDTANAGKSKNGSERPQTETPVVLLPGCTSFYAQSAGTGSGTPAVSIGKKCGRILPAEGQYAFESRQGRRWK